MIDFSDIDRRLEPFSTEPPGERSHGGCAGCGKGEAFAATSACGNGLEKIYPTTAVRFGFMRYIGEFSHVPDMRFTCGAKVVIQSQRGMEIGDQVSLTCTGCDKSVTRDQMREWVERCGEDTFIFSAGRILREATAADLAEHARIQGDSRERCGFAQGIAERQNLPIKVVECETLFGGERILFYFTADMRIDFRGMVKELAREYRTRIEMRQIGARDEARLLADYETCGREVCCKVFLKTLKPISMRMAKVQKATLDPSQVSGRCGRLKCCLRYEHLAYEELDKLLPNIGVRIRTNHGEGVVCDRQILTQLVQIRLDNGTAIAVVAEDITDVNVPAPTEEELKARAAADRESRPGRRKERGRPSRETPQPAGRRKPVRKEQPGADGTDAPDRQNATAPSARAGETDAGQQSRRKRRRRRRGRRPESSGGETDAGSPGA